MSTTEMLDAQKRELGKRLVARSGLNPAQVSEDFDARSTAVGNDVKVTLKVEFVVPRKEFQRMLEESNAAAGL